VRISQGRAKKVGAKLGLDWGVYSLREFTMGMNAELEHRNVTHGNLLVTGKIAKAHLDELPDYYSRLKKIGG
jgi:hypothetical protein